MIDVGSTVEWTSQAGGYTKTKRGVVVEVVQPGHRPHRTRFEKLYKGSGCGWGRKSVSYVVQVGSKLYWPRENALSEVVGGQADTIESIRADRDKWKALAKRAVAIIADAIMHGMPITEEVAEVRNRVVGAA